MTSKSTSYHTFMLPTPIRPTPKKIKMIGIKCTMMKVKTTNCIDAARCSCIALLPRHNLCDCVSDYHTSLLSLLLRQACCNANLQGRLWLPCQFFSPCPEHLRHRLRTSYKDSVHDTLRHVHVSSQTSVRRSGDLLPHQQHLAKAIPDLLCRDSWL